MTVGGDGSLGAPKVTGAVPNRGRRADRERAASAGPEAWLTSYWHPILLLLSVVAVPWLLRLTERGIGVGSDSVVYFVGAQNLIAGEGFTWVGGDGLPRPITHYPPLYSLVLSLLSLLVPSLEAGARFLNATVLGLATYCTGRLAGVLASSGPAAVLAGLVFVASEETLAVHSWAMSDSLYLLISLLCVLFSVAWVRTPDRPLVGLLGWAAAGLGFLSRYVGVSLVAVPLAATLLVGRAHRGRWRLAALGAGLALVPGAAWIVRNWTLTGSATNRRWVFLPLEGGWWRGLWEVVESWFVPGRLLHLLDRAGVVPGVVLATALLVIAVVVVVLRGRLGTAREWTLPALLLLSHLAAVALAAWSGYPGPDVNSRTLAPVFTASVIMGAAALGIAAASGGRPLALVAAVVAIAAVGFKAYAARDFVARLLRDGQGYTSATWSRSDTVRTLIELEPRLLYSDDIAAAVYFTGTYAHMIPLRYDPVTGEQREAFPMELCTMHQRLREDRSYLVLFGRTVLSESGDVGDLAVGLEAVGDVSQGGIYQWRGAPMPALCAAAEG